MRTDDGTNGPCTNFVNIPDGFLGATLSRTRIPIARWSDEMLAELFVVDGCEELRSSTRPYLQSDLRDAGIIDESSSLTPFGQSVLYHIREWKKQSSLRTTPMLSAIEIDETSRLLDVGCGAGQTLAAIGKGPLQSVGIDHDPVAIAFGHRLNGWLGFDFIELYCASGCAIPFRDGYFTHVISRVSLNYMHQGRGIHEMTRVLCAGGIFVAQCEHIGFDLRLLAKCRGPLLLASRLYDLAHGCMLNMFGYQLSPAGPFRPGRCFTSKGRLRKLLQQCGCRMTSTSVLSNTLGLPAGILVTARKLGQ